jgi:hypothetical protein
MDRNLWIMGSIGAVVALLAIAWFLYSADQDANNMECAQENVSRARDGVPQLNCD